MNLKIHVTKELLKSSFHHDKRDNAVSEATDIALAKHLEIEMEEFYSRTSPTVISIHDDTAGRVRYAINNKLLAGGYLLPESANDWVAKYESLRDTDHAAIADMEELICEIPEVELAPPVVGDEDDQKMRVSDMWRVCEVAICPASSTVDSVREKVKAGFYSGAHSIIGVAMLLIRNEGGLDALARLEQMQDEMEQELSEMAKEN
jgi:hypothetical protein